jgi:hypothetical protein
MPNESLTSLARAALEANGSLDPALDELLSAKHSETIVDEVIARRWKHILDTIFDAEIAALLSGDRPEEIEGCVVRPRPEPKIIK